MAKSIRGTWFVRCVDSRGYPYLGEFVIGGYFSVDTFKVKQSAKMHTYLEVQPMIIVCVGWGMRGDC